MPAYAEAPEKNTTDENSLFLPLQKYIIYLSKILA